MKQRSYVVGTAGHVDHGKSSLVKYLTGIDPDRLQEEKERELTIDLGFAWLELPGGAPVSIVDVPGHERFIKNMLAGVGGIDAAILVVAADEGPMPQTDEHLAILDLLGIEAGVVAISKRDLVDDDWLALVIEETTERLSGTVLEDAPLVPVSSTSGEGFDRFLSNLEDQLGRAPERVTRGRPRLSVDRVFSVAGFGTVVTGTLLGDSLRIGQEVELLPTGTRSRVRGLQTHGQPVDEAVPGSRTAVNLTGVNRESVARGDLLTVPGWITPTRMVDARVRLTRSAPRPLEQNDPLDFFVGASEQPAHVTLLDSQRIEPGEAGWVQLRFADPVVAVDGDLFIVRQASPSLTVGGGVVVNAHPRRHRRFRTEVIQELETRLTGTTTDRLVQLVSEAPVQLGEAASQLDVSPGEAAEAASEAITERRLVAPGRGDGASLGSSALLVEAAHFSALTEAVSRALGGFHRSAPLRRGMPKEEVRSRLGVPPPVFDALMQELTVQERVRDLGDVLADPSHEIQLNAEQQAQADRFLAALEAEPVSPPSPSDLRLSREVLGVLIDRGDVVRVDDSLVYGAPQLKRIEQQVLEIIEREGSITLAGFRDHFGTSRKYAQAVLEYFDQERVTRRVGDERVRGRG